VGLTAGWLKQWIQEARHDTSDPWYLQDGPHLGRRDSVLVYGAIRRSGVMLRVPYRVIRDWWCSPDVKETPTGGHVLLSSALSAVWKPVGWIGSMIVAGIVGAEFASSKSSPELVSRLSMLLAFACWTAIGSSALQAWRVMRKIQRILNRWVTHSETLSGANRMNEDLIRFGYSLGDQFRARFRVRSVNPLYFTLVIAIVIFVRLANH
jgi:hypothetical protein